MKINNPPTKKSSMREYEEREHNKSWIPGGKPSPIEENPRAQEIYRRKVAAGIEDADEFPFLMDGSTNKKHRTPLRERRWGEEGNVDNDIQAWKLRNRPNELRKKKPTKAKTARKTVKKVKKCGCK